MWGPAMPLLAIALAILLSRAQACSRTYEETTDLICHRFIRCKPVTTVKPVTNQIGKNLLDIVFIDCNKCGSVQELRRTFSSVKFGLIVSIQFDLVWLMY